MTFRIGVTVTFNEKERQQFSYWAIRRRKKGVIVGMSRSDNCRRVKWAEMKHIEKISIRFLSYLDPLDELIVEDEKKQPKGVEG